MDVQEIKELVIRTASRQEQAERLLLEAFKEVPTPSDVPYLIIGTIPMFWKDFLVDIRDQKVLNAMRTFDLVGGPAYGNCQFSFKGLERRADKFDAVAQLRRTGLVRYSQQIHGKKVGGTTAFFPVAVDMQLRNFMTKTADLYSVASLSGPFLLGMMISTKAVALGLYPDSMGLGEVVRGEIQPGVHSFPIMTSYDFEDIDSIIRPLCDQLHQGFGEEASPKFDSNGKWREGRV
jgi:hypothetical protein